MSVTFSIAGIHHESGAELPCPDCGLTLANAHLHPERDFGCTCMGYGGPDESSMPPAPFELNLSNGNAAQVLRTLELPDAPYGEVDACNLLVALSVRGGLVRDHYRDALLKIGTKAQKYGRKVVWQ